MNYEKILSAKKECRTDAMFEETGKTALWFVGMQKFSKLTNIINNTTITYLPKLNYPTRIASFITKLASLFVIKIGIDYLWQTEYEKHKKLYL